MGRCRNNFITPDIQGKENNILMHGLLCVFIYLWMTFSIKLYFVYFTGKRIANLELNLAITKVKVTMTYLYFHHILTVVRTVSDLASTYCTQIII